MTGNLIFEGMHVAFVAVPLIAGGVISVILLVRYISKQRQGSNG